MTEFGWNTIFDPKNGPLYDAGDASAVQNALDMDNAAGYAMLEPFLRAGVLNLLGQPNAYAAVTRDTPVFIREADGVKPDEPTTLGGMLTKFSGESSNVRESGGDSAEGGSGSGHSVEHNIRVPASTLVQVCPVVLQGSNFTHADVEEHPANVVGGKWYTVHLFLSPEGRSRFFQWSHDHANEWVVFALQGQVATAARISQTLDVNDWEIQPISGRASGAWLGGLCEQT